MVSNFRKSDVAWFPVIGHVPLGIFLHFFVHNLVLVGDMNHHSPEIWRCTLPETNGLPLKIGHPERKIIFQASIFRGYVSFRECTSCVLWMQETLQKSNIAVA